MSRYQNRQDWNQARYSWERNSCLERLQQGCHQQRSIAIFSSTTWRSIAPFLAGELACEGQACQISFFEYEAISANLAVGQEHYETIVLAIDDFASYGALYQSVGAFSKNAQEVLIADIQLRVDLLVPRCSQLILCLPPRAPKSLVGMPNIEQERQRFCVQLLDSLRTCSAIESLDLAEIEASVGPEMHDDRRWQLARIRYSELGFGHLAGAIASRILLRLGQAIKALVLDLDDTLWGGVIGELGIAGIRLGEDYPGSCYREFQQELLNLKHCGMLLAVASKNNPIDAWEVFASHKEMLLARSDIDHAEIGWQPKAESLANILKAFNIGPEAVLFIDDNPRERSAVAAAFPTMAIFDFPDDPIKLCHRLRELPWPFFAATSDEDSRRSHLQGQQASRKKAEQQAVSPESYLQSLSIKICISVNDKQDFARIAQLHQKTNQFNMIPTRLLESDLVALQSEAEAVVLGLRYRDRFGDAGLVGCATLRSIKGKPTVETFMLSCRVIGLGIEHCLLAELTRIAGEPLLLCHQATKKNQPAQEFLTTLDGDFDENGCWLLNSKPASPGWITQESWSIEYAD